MYSLTQLKWRGIKWWFIDEHLQYSWLIIALSSKSLQQFNLTEWPVTDTNKQAWQWHSGSLASTLASQQHPWLDFMQMLQFLPSVQTHAGQVTWRLKVYGFCQSVDVDKGQNHTCKLINCIIFYMCSLFPGSPHINLLKCKGLIYSTNSFRKKWTHLDLIYSFVQSPICSPLLSVQQIDCIK